METLACALIGGALLAFNVYALFTTTSRKRAEQMASDDTIDEQLTRAIAERGDPRLMALVGDYTRRRQEFARDFIVAHVSVHGLPTDDKQAAQVIDLADAMAGYLLSKEGSQ